jgi:hypothetical protein
LAGDHGSGQKREKGNPVLRTRDGEGTQGRKKVVVENRGGEECGKERVAQTPKRGDDQDPDQKSKGDSRGIHPDGRGVEIRDKEEDRGTSRKTERRPDHWPVHEQGL